MTWLNIQNSSNIARNTISPSDYSITKLVWDGPAYGKIANIGDYTATPAVDAPFDQGSSTTPTRISNIVAIDSSGLSALRFNKKYVICGDDFVNIFKLDWQEQKDLSPPPSGIGSIPQDHIFVTKDINIEGVTYPGTFDLDNYIYKFVCNFNMTNLNSDSEDWLTYRQYIAGGLRLLFTKGVNSPKNNYIEKTKNTVDFHNLWKPNISVGSGITSFSALIGPIDVKFDQNSSGKRILTEYPSGSASQLSQCICPITSNNPVANSSNQTYWSDFISPPGFNDDKRSWLFNGMSSIVSKLNKDIYRVMNVFRSDEITQLSSYNNQNLFTRNNYSINNIDPVNHFNFEFFLSKEYFSTYEELSDSGIHGMPGVPYGSALQKATWTQLSTPAGNNSRKWNRIILKRKNPLTEADEFSLPFMSFVFLNLQFINSSTYNSSTYLYNKNVTTSRPNQPFTKHYEGEITSANNAQKYSNDIYNFPADMIKNVEMSIIRIKR
jgi:hypothetical protein